MTTTRTLMKMAIKITLITAPMCPMPTKLTMIRMEKVMPVTMMMTTMVSLMTKTTADWLPTQIRLIQMVSWPLS